jgi:5-methyltetrahydrofolate--homocysteine methyltransferase
MNEIIDKLSTCIEFGKINQKSPYPPSMRGEVGADELTKQALEEGIKPTEILEQGLIPGMNAVGLKFSQGKVFVPEMLMAAKAMSTAMVHLKPYFQSGEVKRKGTFIIGTVFGDLHDIGKNLVAMTIEGAGWEVIDLGVDVKAETFLETLEKHPNSTVGISALLTTTMANMESVVKMLKEKYPATKILVGGAPLNADFCTKIGADFYSRDPQGAVAYLNNL